MAYGMIWSSSKVGRFDLEVAVKNNIIFNKSNQKGGNLHKLIPCNNYDK